MYKFFCQKNRSDRIDKLLAANFYRVRTKWLPDKQKERTETIHPTVPVRSMLLIQIQARRFSTSSKLRRHKRFFRFPPAPPEPESHTAPAY